MRKFVSILALLIIACPLSAAVEIEGLAPDRSITYKTIGDVTLDLHLFEAPGDDGAAARPAIVFFFGGGWTGGSPSQFYPHCAYLASRGMVAISAEYRVESRHGTSPRACVEDGKSAIRWLRAHATELKINPNKIAAGGGSAGGHVAAALGTVDGFDESEEAAAISARPNALVLFNPVYDNGPEGYGHARVQEYWQAISPLHNIDDETPPTIVFLGTEDKLIPVATAEKYKRTMEEHDTRCDLHLYEGRPHGFFNYRGDKKDYHATVSKMDSFLISLGFLTELPAD